MVRWAIRADGFIVGTEYNSEKKAWKIAREFELHCLNQDDPYCPVMTVETEECEC